MTTPSIVYLSPSFELAEEGSPEATLAEIIMPDGSHVFARPVTGEDTTDLSVDLGGKGSGNFKHKGRPGKQGGSAPDNTPNKSDQAAAPRKFNPGAKRYMREEINPEFASWVADLSSQEHRALEEYGGDSYDDINIYLRHGEITEELLNSYSHVEDEGQDPYDAAEETLGHTIDYIDSAIATSPGFEEDTVVYRGLGFDPDLEVGDEFTDSGFISTSLDFSEAVPFTTQYPESEKYNNIVAEITWPEGKPAAYMPPIVHGALLSEMEVLLPRDTTFRVVGIRDTVAEVANRKIPIRILVMEYVS